jgi:hypothetical protein
MHQLDRSTRPQRLRDVAAEQSRVSTVRNGRSRLPPPSAPWRIAASSGSGRASSPSRSSSDSSVSSRDSIASAVRARLEGRLWVSASDEAELMHGISRSLRGTGAKKPKPVFVLISARLDASGLAGAGRRRQAKGQREAMATARRAARRGLLARLIRWILRIVIGLFLLFVLALALYRFMPVPSTLMLGRWLTLQPVEREWVPLSQISPALIRP